MLYCMTEALAVLLLSAEIITRHQHPKHLFRKVVPFGLAIWVRTEGSGVWGAAAP